MNNRKAFLTEFFHQYDPRSLEAYIKLGGFDTLKKVIKADKKITLQTIVDSGLRGRGGAGYPTGLKLQQSAAIPGDEKFIICNADEGEPGTFKDREFLEFDPFKIIESMIICAFLTGATKGYMYIREEYRHLHDLSKNAVSLSLEKGFLGHNILGENFNFHIQVFSGAGAYVCGEGGALIESIEGKQGKPRRKPPQTKECGLWQLPTLVINVETLAAIATILRHKTNDSKTPGYLGSKMVSLSGKINQPGAYEVDFGMTFKEIINQFGGGMIQGSEPTFLQLGGASGPIIPKEKYDLKLSYDEMKKNGYCFGSGCLVVADQSTSLVEYLQTVYDFFQDESCGKCTSCREGNRQIGILLNKIVRGEDKRRSLDLAVTYAEHMKETAFCGLGKTAPAPLLSAAKDMYDVIIS